ncbi:hypothetical protein Tcan_03328 [Toxocara canis]|uniref:Secreted protein n=1 Tax=Toxocara canis TaxID=6265 RepID=A0A0B2VXS7_TOXCA|nr:hypothetical protein Tcan_03328 [Toxocara canis]
MQTVFCGILGPMISAFAIPTTTLWEPFNAHGHGVCFQVRSPVTAQKHGRRIPQYAHFRLLKGLHLHECPTKTTELNHASIFRPLENRHTTAVAYIETITEKWKPSEEEWRGRIVPLLSF